MEAAYSEAFLDQQFRLQCAQYNETFVALASEADKDIICDWLCTFHGTPTGQKLARNCLMLLLHEQLAEFGILRLPFTDTRKCGRNLNVLLNMYAADIVKMKVMQQSQIVPEPAAVRRAMRAPIQWKVVDKPVNKWNPSTRIENDYELHKSNVPKLSYISNGKLVIQGSYTADLNAARVAESTMLQRTARQQDMSPKRSNISLGCSLSNLKGNSVSAFQLNNRTSSKVPTFKHPVQCTSSKTKPMVHTKPKFKTAQREPKLAQQKTISNIAIKTHPSKSTNTYTCIPRKPNERKLCENLMLQRVDNDFENRNSSISSENADISYKSKCVDDKTNRAVVKTNRTSVKPEKNVQNVVKMQKILKVSVQKVPKSKTKLVPPNIREGHVGTIIKSCKVDPINNGETGGGTNFAACVQCIIDQSKDLQQNIIADSLEDLELMNGDLIKQNCTQKSYTKFGSDIYDNRPLNNFQRYVDNKIQKVEEKLGLEEENKSADNILDTMLKDNDKKAFLRDNCNTCRNCMYETTRAEAKKADKTDWKKMPVTLSIEAHREIGSKTMMTLENRRPLNAGLKYGSQIMKSCANPITKQKISGTKSGQKSTTNCSKYVGSTNNSHENSIMENIAIDIEKRIQLLSEAQNLQHMENLNDATNRESSSNMEVSKKPTKKVSFNVSVTKQKTLKVEVQRQAKPEHRLSVLLEKPEDETLKHEQYTDKFDAKRNESTDNMNKSKCIALPTVTGGSNDFQRTAPREMSNALARIFANSSKEQLLKDIKLKVVKKESKETQSYVAGMRTNMSIWPSSLYLNYTSVMDKRLPISDGCENVKCSTLQPIQKNNNNIGNRAKKDHRSAKKVEKNAFCMCRAKTNKIVHKSVQREETRKKHTKMCRICKNAVGKDRNALNTTMQKSSTSANCKHNTEMPEMKMPAKKNKCRKCGGCEESQHKLDPEVLKQRIAIYLDICKLHKRNVELRREYLKYYNKDGSLRSVKEWPRVRVRPRKAQPLRFIIGGYRALRRLVSWRGPPERFRFFERCFEGSDLEHSCQALAASCDREFEDWLQSKMRGQHSWRRYRRAMKNHPLKCCQHLLKKRLAEKEQLLLHMNQLLLLRQLCVQQCTGKVPQLELLLQGLDSMYEKLELQVGRNNKAHTAT